MTHRLTFSSFFCGDRNQIMTPPLESDVFVTALEHFSIVSIFSTVGGFGEDLIGTSITILAWISIFATWGRCCCLAI
jgi:hypothetical protein